MIPMLVLKLFCNVAISQICENSIALNLVNTIFSEGHSVSQSKFKMNCKSPKTTVFLGL